MQFYEPTTWNKWSVSYLSVRQFLPSRSKVERYAFRVSWHRGSTDQQAHQDQVRKRGREVHRL